MTPQSNLSFELEHSLLQNQLSQRLMLQQHQQQVMSDQNLFNIQSQQQPYLQHHQIQQPQFQSQTVYSNPSSQPDIQLLLLEQMKQHDQMIANQQRMFEEQIKNQQQMIQMLQMQLQQLQVQKDDNHQQNDPYQTADKNQRIDIDCQNISRNIDTHNDLHTPVMRQFRTTSMNNSILQTNSASKTQRKLPPHQSYLESRHKQTQDKMEKLRQEKRDKELQELRDKPTIKQRLSSLKNRDSTTSKERNSSYQRQIEKNNPQAVNQKSKMLMKENGISFTPRITKKSQSLERSVEDLLEWNKTRQIKAQNIIESKIKEQTKILNNSVKLCPGSFKIIQQNSAEKENPQKFGERLYTKAMDSLTRKQENIKLTNKTIQQRMIPQITPKGQKSQPLFLSTNTFGQIKTNTQKQQPKPKQKKYIPKKERQQSKQQKIRDKLNSFIQNKYLTINNQNSLQQQSIHTQATARREINGQISPMRISQACSPTFETNKSIQHFHNIQQLQRIDTTSSQGSDQLKQLSVKSNVVNQDVVQQYLDQKLDGDQSSLYQQNLSPQSTTTNKREIESIIQQDNFKLQQQMIQQHQQQQQKLIQPQPIYQHSQMPMIHPLQQVIAQLNPNDPLQNQQLLLQQIEYLKQTLQNTQKQQQQMIMNPQSTIVSEAQISQNQGKRMDSRNSLSDEEELFKYSIDDQSNQIIHLSNNNSTLRQ